MLKQFAAGNVLRLQTIEGVVRRGDAAFCQITVHLLLLLLLLLLLYVGLYLLHAY